MVFLVTSKGFLKEKITTVVDKKPIHEYVWTDKLREAQIFTSRGKVHKFLEGNKLEGFAYNPKEQEPIRDKYKVIKRRDYTFDSHKHEVYEWIVEKAIMLHNSDINFLRTGENNNDDLYDLPEAIKICEERNNKMLQELTEKIKTPVII